MKIETWQEPIEHEGVAMGFTFEIMGVAIIGIYVCWTSISFCLFNQMIRLIFGKLEDEI
jgi:hypothetical protein